MLGKCPYLECHGISRCQLASNSDERVAQKTAYGGNGGNFGPVRKSPVFHVGIDRRGVEVASVPQQNDRKCIQ